MAASAAEFHPIAAEPTEEPVRVFPATASAADSPAIEGQPTWLGFGAVSRMSSDLWLP